MNLIPRKDRNQLHLKKWGPITLLNTDYKIPSLTVRMKPYLDRIIHSSQTGFMHWRNIAFNIRKAIDSINFVDNENIEALVISLDFRKAFDRVEKCAIKAVLEYFNFGEKFIKWILLLYVEFESCTQNSGFMSEWFKPSRGLHQGACESPKIFMSVP